MPINFLKKLVYLKFNFFILMLLSLGLTACDRNRHLHDLETFVAQTKQSNVNRSKKNLLEGIKEPKAVMYTSNSVRSPFEVNPINAPVNPSAAKHPLQAYPVLILRYKGIATQEGKITAFILTPDEKIYHAKIGDIIGDHYGKIIGIYPDRIEVQERVEAPNAKGIPQISQRIVTLQRKEASDGQK